MRALIIGMTVNYVPAGASKPVEAELVEPLGTSALLDYGKADSKGNRDRSKMANAAYSRDGEENTYHFIDEADEVKKNKQAGAQGANGSTAASA